MVRNDLLPKAEDVAVAAERLTGVAVRTPLLESESFNDLVGCRALLKAETLQLGGAYKFRGAYNRLSRLTSVERTAGVVAWSSGNHAIAVSLAAKLLGVAATLVMPEDAPEAKRDAVISHGGKIVYYDRYNDDREEIARTLCRRQGATLVPSFDDPDIIAGQGTVALELFAQVAAIGAIVDTLVVPCGGGGLAAGSCLVAAAQDPPSKVYAVEPAASDDTKRSLERGKRVRLPRNTVRTICDALALPEPGELTFTINQALLAGAVSVDDHEVTEAMRLIFDKLKLVVEPSAAVGVAALLNGKIPHRGIVAIILSGANVNRQFFSKIIAGDC